MGLVETHHAVEVQGPTGERETMCTHRISYVHGLLTMDASELDQDGPAGEGKEAITGLGSPQVRVLPLQMAGREREVLHP